MVSRDARVCSHPCDEVEDAAARVNILIGTVRGEAPAAASLHGASSGVGVSGASPASDAG